MISAKGYAAHDSTSPLSIYEFERRNPDKHDVVIDILYCGICHSDLHSVKNEWGGANYPLVPGHEIIGKVREVGDSVTKFKDGDIVGIGCFIDSCGNCYNCKDYLEQYCDQGMTMTYNSLDKDGKTYTKGGYSNVIIANENYIYKIKNNDNLAAVAPLLCAGITTYSPLKKWGVKKGSKVGVIGLGGLGHMAIKLANSMGAEVTVFTRSSHKIDDAKKLGATDVILTKDIENLENYKNSLDLIINTVSELIEISPYINTLKRDGVMVMLGIPSKQLELNVRDLILRRRCVAGSLIGGTKETQEMLDYCYDNNIVADVEIIPIDKVNEAFDRMLKSDVKYRFVIDMQSLN